MVYIEEQVKNNKTYYYLVKSERCGPTSWKKDRKYCGDKKPAQEDIDAFAAESVPIKYLTKEQASTLTKIKQGYRIHINKLLALDLNKLETANLTHFAYNTSAIEGSSMSLHETGYLLEEKRTPEGKDLWEIHSALNTREALKYLKNMKEITHSAIKELHEIAMRGIVEEELGEYRTVGMRIIGGRHRPPLPTEVPELMDNLISWYRKSKLNTFELACLFHTKFEGIHPFRDGNGRVGRLLLNFILQKHGFPMLDIPASQRIEYYKCLDAANVSKRFKPFIDFAVDIYVKDAKAIGWV